MIQFLIFGYLLHLAIAAIICFYIKSTNLLKSVFNGWNLLQLFLCFILPIFGLLPMIGAIMDIFIHYNNNKEKQMNLLTVHRKPLKIHYVENIPCYVVDGKIHQLPKLEREDAKLYLVSETDDRNKVSRVEITYEE